MNETIPPKAGAREWIGLAVLALPTLLVAIDLFVLLLALPSLSADLAPSNNEQLWILDVYGFLLAGFMITMGTLGDRVGKRRLLLIGAVAFVAASVLAAYSTNPEMLIAARAVTAAPPAASTSPASPSRWPRCCPASTASRSWPARAGRRCRWPRSGSA